MTLVGVTLSHYLTSRRLALVQAESEAQRVEVCELRDALGILCVEDRRQVAIRYGYGQYSFGQIGLSERDEAQTDEVLKRLGLTERAWQMHLPGEFEWRLCWFIGDLPTKGIAQDCSGSRILPLATDDWRPKLYVTLSKNSAGPHGVTFLVGSTATEMKRVEWSIELPRGSAPWIDPEQKCHEYVAARQQTETSAVDEPVVLLRRYVASSEEPTEPSNRGGVQIPGARPGIVIWIERLR
jgi:hypothetical protein